MELLKIKTNKKFFTTELHGEEKRINIITPCPPWLFIPVIFVVLLAGCSSLVQKSGEFLEGSAFAEKTFAVYRSNDKTIELKEKKHKSGEESIEISNSAWPGLTLRGNKPGSEGNFEFSGARILSSHVHGWNEFNLELLGQAVFSAGNEAVLRTEGEVERVQISSGEIRLKSSRLAGNAALVQLRNRRERILAITEWMKERQLANYYTVVFRSQNEFDEYWKALLFPELTANKKRPPEYSAVNALWFRKDGVNWNQTYTEHLLPQELRELRNSGALLRDWEEALPWIFMEYSWDYIINSLDGTFLQKR